MGRLHSPLTVKMCIRFTDSKGEQRPTGGNWLQSQRAEKWTRRATISLKIAAKRGHLNFKIQSSEFSIQDHFPVSMQSKLLLLYIIWWGRNDCGMHLSKPPFKMLLLKNVGSIKTLTIKWMFLQSSDDDPTFCDVDFPFSFNLGAIIPNVVLVAKKRENSSGPFLTTKQQWEKGVYSLSRDRPNDICSQKKAIQGDRTTAIDNHHRGRRKEVNDS